ncbi:MAG: OsmC family protein, partial [Ferruginibacter sp.]|nr:OsmC family protein [Ferruginibacter sp.]
MSIVKFSIKGESKTATKFEAKARNFSFTIDEPGSLGGTNTAPNPVEYLLGSLAGCLNIVLHLEAKEQNVVINNLKIDIEGDLDPAKFVGLPGFNRSGFQHINITINLEADATEETINDIINRAKARCPI